MDAAAAAASLMGLEGQPAADPVGPPPSDPDGTALGAALDLASLYKRCQQDRIHRPGADKLAALRERIEAGKAKIAAAEAKGADPKKLKAARLTIAGVEDELSAAVRAEIAWLVSDAAYLIGKALVAPELKGEVPAGASLTFYLPGVSVLSLALDGPDDEPPF